MCHHLLPAALQAQLCCKVALGSCAIAVVKEVVSQVLQRFCGEVAGRALRCVLQAATWQCIAVLLLEPATARDRLLQACSAKGLESRQPVWRSPAWPPPGSCGSSAVQLPRQLHLLV